MIINTVERIALNEQLKSLSNEEWSNDVLGNATFISEDTLNAIFKDKSRGWPYFHEQYGIRVYHFSRPILLYDNTISIFYYNYFDENVFDQGELVVFKKEKKIWKKWLTLYRSASLG